MKSEDLIQRLDKAAGYISIATTGYVVDENGRPKAINGNDRGRYAGMAWDIVNGLIEELERAGAEINNP